MSRLNPMATTCSRPFLLLGQAGGRAVDDMSAAISPGLWGLAMKSPLPPCRGASSTRPGSGRKTRCAVTRRDGVSSRCPQASGRKRSAEYSLSLPYPRPRIRGQDCQFCAHLSACLARGEPPSPLVKRPPVSPSSSASACGASSLSIRRRPSAPIARTCPNASRSLVATAWSGGTAPKVGYRTVFPRSPI